MNECETLTRRTMAAKTGNRRGEPAVGLGGRTQQRGLTLAFLALLFATVLTGCAAPDPELRAAADKQSLCLACHGADGRSVSAPAPVLAGQQQAYLAAQLTAFRSHARADADARAYMWPMAASLSDASIESLAAYFAAMPPPRMMQPPTDHDTATATAAGQSIYDKGLPERGAPACGGCHGDKGQGLATFPRLAGQHPDYLTAQLAAFANGSRANPIMGPIAKSLGVDEAQRVAAYLAALP